MKSIQIGGFTPFTTIDYPEKLACVIFLIGCPMRCAYCSNYHLIKAREGEYDPDKIIELLKTRVNKLEAVVFSGGEALMQGETTINYIKKIKELGFLIGLHTNGYYPELLDKSLKYIDWIGLDIKTNKENYEKLTKLPLSYNKVMESLNIIIKSKKDFEVRITCDPRFVSKDIIIDLSKQLSQLNVKTFALQKYRPIIEDNTTEKDREEFFNDDEFKNIIKNYFSKVYFRE